MTTRFTGSPGQKINEIFKIGGKADFTIVSIEPREHRLGLIAKKDSSSIAPSGTREDKPSSVKAPEDKGGKGEGKAEETGKKLKAESEKGKEKKISKETAKKAKREIKEIKKSGEATREKTSVQRKK